MTSFFDKISNKFSSNSSKKFLMQIMSSAYELQAKYQPLQLKKILSTQTGKNNFIKQLSSVDSAAIGNRCSEILIQKIKTESMFRVLKKLSLFHHVVIYYNQYAELIQEVQLQEMIPKSIQAEWFVVNIIKPYICFIKKFCLSIQMYQKLRSMPCGSKQTIFQSMCFAVNILKSLFSVVSKLPALGRYFRQKSPSIVDYFVQIMSYHAQQVYQGFRGCITQIISFSKDHLSKKQDELIAKQILSEDLAWINEQMKKLFLDKYFFPYGKGYGVKLYKLEDQNEYQSQVINGILNDHKYTERQNQAKLLEQTLFNVKVFNHEELQKSFNFSLAKIRSQQQQKSLVDNPQKQEKEFKSNITLPNLQKEIKKKFQTNQLFKNQRVIFQEQFVEDV